jgi:hypothetical protein
VPSDNAVLATLATAFLVRDGGKTTFTSEEWQAAIEHEATIWVAKEDTTVTILFLAKEGARA